MTFPSSRRSPRQTPNQTKQQVRREVNKSAAESVEASNSRVAQRCRILAYLRLALNMTATKSPGPIIGSSLLQRIQGANEPAYAAGEAVAEDPAAASASQAPQTSAQAQQQQDETQTLTNAQDAAINNPNYQPNTPSPGNTHCNEATCSIAMAVGAPIGALADAQGHPLKADQIRASLAKPGSGYKEVSASEAQQLANRGALVIVAGPGHVATVRPDSGQKVAGHGPIVANVGKANGVMRLSRAFNKSAMPEVKFYTPN